MTQVLYSPLSAGSFSAGQIAVTSSSQSVGSVTCTGYALRPSVNISTTAVDFGSSPLGSSVSSSFSLFNTSKVHISFQFMISTSAVFQIHPEKGIIRPESNLSIHIEFRPHEARNYYRRIFCLVQDQHVLYCDFVGSCYLEKVNFPTLQLPHITEERRFLPTAVHGFQSASFAGIGENNVQEVSHSMPACANDSSDIYASVSEGSSVHHHKKSAPCSLENISEGACVAEDIWEEYFLGRSRGLNFVEISPKVLHFGDIPHPRKSEEQNVVVRNISATPILCVWEISDMSWRQDGHVLAARWSTTQVVQSKGPWIKHKVEDVFQVSPQSATIAPQTSTTFHVTFAPKQQNRFHVETLDLFIFQLCEDNHVIAPYQASLQVSGSSFTCDEQKFLPQAGFFPSKVVFPPALRGSRVYQTLALRNQGCTPLWFSFDTSCLSCLFSVKPLQGLVQERSFQLISIRFEAGDPTSHVVKLPCILNDNSNEKVVLTLIARSDILQVELEEDKLIHFKPTNIGIPSEKTLTLQNISSIPAVFNWSVPKEMSQVFTFKPHSGILLGNQQVEVTCSFCPTSPLGFRADVSCLTAAMIEKTICTGKRGATITRFYGPEISKIFAIFEGEGRDGSLNLEPQQIQLGTILVGFPQRHKLTISNPSDGLVKYVLNFASLKETNNDGYNLKFDNRQGSIPAHSATDVTITFKAKAVSNFTVGISCSLHSSINSDGQRTEEMPQCILLAKALFPSLSLCGARGEGFSQAQAWCRLQLNVLDLLLAETEITQNAGLRGCQDLFGLGGTFSQQWRSAFNFCFGRGHVASKPTVFILVLKTRNDLPVSWKIRLWNDKDVDLENWVEEPEPSNEKEHIYMNVREEGLIQVFPSEGHLNPQEKVQIKFLYRHYVEGMHTFPAILQIKNGCTLPIMFSGETLSREVSILSLASPTFMLKPVEVGDANPPLQTFELRNNGNSFLNYEVDPNPLQYLQQENFGFEVLSCLNPIGSIPPGETLLLNWRFQPIETKSYAVDVFISVELGEGAMLHVQGIGIEKAPRGNLQPPEERTEGFHHPSVPSCEWVGLPAMLTLEHLSYGNIQVLSSLERLIAVKNCNADTRVSFSWHCSYAADKSVYGHFSVMPSQGIIERGGSCMCKITFTAGMQPQCFHTTLYCDIQEVIPEQSSKDVQSQEDDRNEELFAKDWERLGSTASSNESKECRQYAVSTLTCSMNQRLPRLSAKGPLRFSTSATLKPPTDDEQGIKSEQIKKNRGVLYLSVSGIIYSIATLQKMPVKFDHPQEQKDFGDIQGQLLEEMLEEAMQEVMDAQLVASRLQNTKASFFEQFDKLRDLSNMRDLPNNIESRSAAVVSSGADPLAIERVPQLEPSVGIFDLAKMMLEFMLFEVVKELHECETRPSLGSS